ncbi:MAG: carbohydrate ABC transporter permease [Sphaerochaetaceae bacterium]|jgi:putative aldouronate transport system permease protein|nr:carbohydrate ABC transporter permease [Sphaerochaetaceae bacterium]
MKHKTLRQLKSDKVFDVLNMIFLVVCFIVVLYPLLYILSCSLSNAQKVVQNKVWLWPVDPDIEAYKAVFRNKDIITGYKNSLIYVISGTFVSVMLTMFLAYPLSRKEFYGRKTITTMMIITMLFSGGMIPLFLVVKQLGMYNTIWAMILPNAITVWNVVIARTFLQENITNDLYDAAQIDGCSDIKFLFKIVFPLSGAIVAVLALFYAVSQWNKYMDALLYLQDKKLYPLQIVLRNILIINSSTPSMMTDVAAAAKYQGLSQTVRYAVIVVASLPLLIAYPFVQKFFVKGVMIGSVKG